MDKMSEIFTCMCVCFKAMNFSEVPQYFIDERLERQVIEAIALLSELYLWLSDSILLFP